MSRLNNRAFEILRTEVQKCTGDDPVSKVEQEIVLKRLQKLRSQQGSPASLEDLRDTIVDVLPQFSEQALKAAAKANRPAGSSSKITWAAGILVGTAGLIWVANLPYPMIRWPVARTAPILLLPSYISMDHNYRRAVALVEQADQLVNRATGPADFELGAQKVKEAQKHLDALPVWFLGYWPQYTFWFGWQFTLDEFKSARANVARMDAKLFQEKQAQTLLTQGEQTLNTAKQQYQQASTPVDKEKAIASWQAALDQMEQIPRETLAGQAAQTKLAAYKRDFQQVAALAAGSARSGTLIEAAKQFAMQAAMAGQNPPHAAAQWQQVERLWSVAINRLEQVTLEDPGYSDAQKLLATYQNNRGIVQTRLQAEKESQAALEQAQSQINLLANSTFADRNNTISQIQTIINQLEKVQAGTTAYPKAQELLLSAHNKLKQLQPQG